MAPAISNSLELLSRSVRTILKARDDPITPIVSVFALVLSTSPQLTSTAISLLPRSPSLDTSSLRLDTLIHSIRIHARSQLSNAFQGITKRQSTGEYILVIPTTYKGLNAGPSPTTVVGITLGVVGGLLLVIYIFGTIWGFPPWGNDSETVIEEEVIRHRSKRSSSRRRSTHRPMSEVRRPSGRIVIDEEIIIEERRSNSPSAIEVEEYDDEDEDVVEVMEENSPEPSEVVEVKKKKKKSRRESGRVEGESGFRIVDPAEPGGGSAPRRKISRR